MRKWLPAVFLVLICVVLPALGAWVGARLTSLQLKKKPWQVPEQVQRRVTEWQEVETLGGAFAHRKMAIEGVERCYYSTPPDVSRITWIGPDIPTPFVGYAPRPGPMASGYINAMQFRYDRELAGPKPKDTYRIFLVGGSTAYGAGATANATTIGGYLEKYLNERTSGGRRFEVITGAANAWASTHERILVENRLIELEPDLVIAFSGHNDAHWSSLDRNVLWFRSYQDDYYHLLANSVLSCNFDQDFPGEDPGGIAAVSPETAAQRLVWNVGRTQAALASVGADYVFALQPILVCSRKSRSPREARMAPAAEQSPLAPYYAEFRRVLPAALPADRFVDLTGVFDKEGPDVDVFIDGCHFGDRGNDRIAQALCERVGPIVRQRVLSQADED